MAHKNPNVLIPVQLNALGTLTQADDKDQKTIDFPAVIWRVSATIGNTGTTSGNNTFVLEKNGTTDLFTVAADAGTFAYNAAAKYQEFDWENAAWTGYASGQTYPPSGCQIAAGDYIRLNVDSVASAGTPADLTVTVWLKPLAA